MESDDGQRIIVNEHELLIGNMRLGLLIEAQLLNLKVSVTFLRTTL